MPKFTEDEKSNLISELKGRSDRSRKTSKVNQGYDIAFKVSISLFSLGVILSSAFAVSDVFKDTRIISLISAVLGALSAALSGLSTNVFNFATRQQVWQLKSSGYDKLSDRVKFIELDDDATLRIKGELDLIDDSYTIEKAQAILQKIDTLQSL